MASFVLVAGSANGYLDLAQGVKDAHEAGKAAAKAAGFTATRKAAPKAAESPEAAMEPVWLMPQARGRSCASRRGLIIRMT